MLSLPLAAFVPVWAFLAVNIATPGPNVLNTIAAAIGSGRRAGVGSALGVGLGIGLWCVGMTAGMGALFALWPGLRTVLTVVAAALLLRFAFRAATQARAGWQRRGDPALPDGRQGQTVRAAFLRSLAVNATNPKALTSWTAVLAIFPVDIARPGDIALLTAGASALSLGIHGLYALAFSSAPAARAYLRAAPAINAGVALFFTAFAGALLAEVARVAGSG